MNPEIPLHQTTCLHCGEIVNYQGFTRRIQPARNEYGLIDRSLPSETIEIPNPRAGWTHHDGRLRDHTAFPSDLREPEQDMERQRRGFSAARIGMKRHISRQFDTIHAEHTVNEIAREMGLGDQGW